MNKKQKAYYILSKIEEIYPDALTELMNWETDFQFLVCIMLSAQTTDIQVNNVTKGIFKLYPDASALADLDPEQMMDLIRSINFYRTKAKHIVQTAKIIRDEYNGVVPTKLKKLTELPGVGYKTANVFLNDFYKANQGVAVDTHVARVSQRLGLTENTDPNKISKDLEKLYNKKDWYKINQLFVMYGRYICKARVDPKKSECVFKEFCSHCGGD